ncbi:hypothetical protein E2562_018426 [Oryza meyeriana var. granulata]|uniref:Uncharacterized protein n=1 Tax=Oryza meyeriana var. granulata TaxID=110450 RepID=A0A6G1EMB6_9ORYZ|nr:hypothetical protein E2562_018426 [Oryza meyeriana var. granulata]
MARGGGIGGGAPVWPVRVERREGRDDRRASPVSGYGCGTSRATWAHVRSAEVGRPRSGVRARREGGGRGGPWGEGERADGLNLAPGKRRGDFRVLHEAQEPTGGGSNGLIAPHPSAASASSERRQRIHGLPKLKEMPKFSVIASAV